MPLPGQQLSDGNFLVSPAYFLIPFVMMRVEGMPMKTMRIPKTKQTEKKHQLQRDIAATYDEFKKFEGQYYTGVKIGRGHKWYYDQGEWKEKKVAPDRWEFTYAVTKRRAGKAPEGSGVPVGTEYHWYILAHQNVRKLNANDYTTSMTGLKFKLAHKRADREKWSVGEQAQRRHLVKILETLIVQLKKTSKTRASLRSEAAHAVDGRKR
jgi:hypothetical protein